MKGPTTIQSIEYQTCLGCDYHKQVMRKSGRDPIYDHFCQHPDMKEFEGYFPGRHIGTKQYTPSWCPFLARDK